MPKFPAWNNNVTTIVVQPHLVNMVARVTKCVTSRKEDSSAHAHRDTLGTDANWKGPSFSHVLCKSPCTFHFPWKTPPYHSPPPLAPAPWFTCFVWTPALRFTSYLTVPAPFTSMQESQPASTPMLVTQPSLPPRPCRDVVTSANQKKNGIYQILNDQNVSFPVYRDFG